MSETTIGGTHAAAPTRVEELVHREPTSYDDSGDAALNEQAKNLDLEAWINGVTGIERAVTLYGNMAVTAQIDVVKTRIAELNQMQGDSGERAKLREDLAELTRTQVESSVDVVLEGVSAEALARRWKTVDGAKDASGAKLSEEAKLCRVIAQQIKKPAGFSAGILEELNSRSPGQFGKILQAWKSVLEESNVQVKGITAPLSRGA